MVEVFANRHDGTLAGARVAKGQLMQFSASTCDWWDMGLKGPVGAAGISMTDPFVSMPPGAAFGSLVGWIRSADGAALDAFEVGLKRANYQAPEDGEVLLRANDNFDDNCVKTYGSQGCHYDNRGWIRVCVTM